MIRRESGGDYFLITQNDHALLAGMLAGKFGNERFASMKPWESILTGVRMHDAGWPIHDDEPTLNAGNLPLDVFEVPRPIALKVWAASAERAAAVDPYAGLLVSLHSLALSIYATSKTPMKHEKFDVNQLSERFEVNKFQHREVERQEELRRKLNLRTDLPLTHGLAQAGMSMEEDQLTFNFRLLQAMDLISLCLCCTEPPAHQTQEVLPAPRKAATHLRLERGNDGAITVDPWPFGEPAIHLTVPFRRVPGRSYRDAMELREIYGKTAIETMAVRVSPAMG